MKYKGPAARAGPFVLQSFKEETPVKKKSYPHREPVQW